MKTYRGYTMRETGTTTDGTRMVFGKPFPCIRYVWAIEGSGPAAKGACRTPFLTSAAACREWIDANS